jgi:hypothetical protein
LPDAPRRRARKARRDNKARREIRGVTQISAGQTNKNGWTIKNEPTSRHEQIRTRDVQQESIAPPIAMEKQVASETDPIALSRRARAEKCGG